MPTELAALPLLEHCDLRNNRLRELPAALADAPTLRKLDLRWNACDEDDPVVHRLRARGCRVLF